MNRSGSFVQILQRYSYGESPCRVLSLRAPQQPVREPVGRLNRNEVVIATLEHGEASAHICATAFAPELIN